MAKWMVPVIVDEDMLREYYGQTSEDPGTTAADVRDFMSDVFAAASDSNVGGGEGAFKLSEDNCTVLRDAVVRSDDSEAGDSATT